MLNQWLFTSNTDLRATPQDFYDQLNEEFRFTLDPCATHENHKCDKYYTKEQDGLVQSRDNEIVYCNPPYWREIKKRVQKWAFARGGLSLCSYQQGLIHLDSMISYITNQKSDLSEDAWNLEIVKIQLHFQVW